jgi:hypothetical protein
LCWTNLFYLSSLTRPLRVFSEKYYPHLTALYKHVGIKSVPENYSGSFSIKNSLSPFFVYQNWLTVGGLSLPFVSWRHVFSMYVKICAPFSLIVMLPFFNHVYLFFVFYFEFVLADFVFVILFLFHSDCLLAVSSGAT